MSPKVIYDTISKLFSDDGFTVNGYTVKSESPLVACLTNNNGVFELEFGNNNPKVEITKFITLYAYIEQINFGETGGVVKLRNFPDFKFSYTSSMFNSCPMSFESDSIKKEITSQYSSKRDREIAKKCLQYAEEWATICHQSGVTFDNADYADRYILYNNCYDFVEENIKADVEDRYGSVILTWLFVYVVLPMIIKWIVNKVLERLFND